VRKIPENGFRRADSDARFTVGMGRGRPTADPNRAPKQHSRSTERRKPSRAGLLIRVAGAAVVRYGNVTP
jgi:hypothetical protein